MEQSRRASLPEIVQTDVDQTTQAIENLSIFEKIKKTFPTTSRKTSDSSEGSSEERRDSLRSSCSWGGAAESRRGSGVSTFGNHGIFGPLLGLEETPEPKREKCLLSRRWSAISIALSQIRCAVCKLFVQFLIRSNNFLLSPPTRTIYNTLGEHQSLLSMLLRAAEVSLRPGGEDEEEEPEQPPVLGPF